MARPSNPHLDAEMVLTEVAQLKAISDSFRLRIVETMAEEHERTWTAKELAERLDAKQTKLYHHLNLLEQHGILRVAETRIVSGILEKRYRPAARSFRVDRSLLTGGEGVEPAVGRVLDVIFERARDEVLASARAGLLDVSDEERRRRMALSTTHARLSPAAVRRVMRLIEKLGTIDAEEDPNGTDYGLVVAFYPRAPREPKP